MVRINVAHDYTKKPGGRHIVEGQFSGEDFREKLLKPGYEKAIKDGTCLEIILDGGYGYGSSFLEESFGGLVREIGKVDLSKIKIVSDEEPQLIEDIKKYLSDAIASLEGEKKR